jgi:hypothetical protein
MKNFTKLFGVIALVAVIGFSTAACEDDPPKDAFTGTWIGTVNGQEMTLVAANGSWKALMGGNEVYRGTYTGGGNNITFKFTQVNTGLLSGGASQWKSYSELTGGELEYVPGETVPVTINGNQVDMGGTIFTKQ